MSFLRGGNRDVSRQIKQEMLIIELLSLFRFGGWRRRGGRFARKKGDTWSDGRFSPKERRKEREPRVKNQERPPVPRKAVCLPCMPDPNARAQEMSTE